MKGSLRLFKVFGIPVELHWSFGLLLAWIVFSSVSSGMSFVDTAINVLFIMALFMCVVLHEFGHALTARHFGVETRDIILSPIGGIARLERLPEKPIQEFLVAIAGPLVNIGIAILLLPYFWFVPDGDFMNRVANPDLLQEGIGFIPGLLALNVILAVFNLLPAFPMDGGRIVRSLLSLKFSRVTATRIAARIGQTFGVLFVLWAFLPAEWIPFGLGNGGLFTAFIGVFVFFTASQELQSAKTDELLSGYRVGDLYRKEFTKLNPSDPLWVASSYMRQGVEKNFLVYSDEDLPIGSLNETTLLKAIGQHQQNKDIASIYHQGEMLYLTPEMNLKKAYENIYKSGHMILPVVENDQITGVFEAEMVNKILQLTRIP